jgi:hypothetical protein
MTGLFLLVTSMKEDTAGGSWTSLHTWLARSRRCATPPPPPPPPGGGARGGGSAR